MARRWVNRLVPCLIAQPRGIEGSILENVLDAVMDN